LKQVQQELEKPKGQGRLEPVRNLMSFAADFGQLLLLASQFVAGQSARIKSLTDFAGTVLPNQ
jgi:hypothetical protein